MKVVQEKRGHPRWILKTKLAAINQSATISTVSKTGPTVFPVGRTVSNLGYVHAQPLGVEQLRGSHRDL
jgi:hypothetical protein